MHVNNQNLRDEIGQFMATYPRTSKEVQDRIKGMEHSLAQLNQAVGPLSDLTSKLRDYETVVQNSMAELRERNQALLAQIDTERREHRLAQEQNERDAMRRMQDQKAELELHCARQLEEEREKYGEMLQRMIDQKGELEHRLTKQIDDEREEHKRNFRQAKTSFKDALNETSYQVKQLELERNLWHTKYNDLAKSIDEMKMKMKADCQKQLQDRFRQFVSDWNRQDLGRYAPRQEPTLPRIDNIAEVLRDDSAQSYSVGDGNEAFRRRAMSNREDAARYVADRVASGQANLPQGRNMPATR